MFITPLVDRAQWPVPAWQVCLLQPASRSVGLRSFFGKTEKKRVSLAYQRYTLKAELKADECNSHLPSQFTRRRARLTGFAYHCCVLLSRQPSNAELALLAPLIALALHEFRETCQSVTFIALVNSHQR